MFVATSEKGSGRREGQGPWQHWHFMDSSVTSRVLWRLQPHSCYPKQWLPFTECCPCAQHQTACHTGLSHLILISIGAFTITAIFHLADKEVDLERVRDLPKVTQLLELRAESKPGSEQGSQDPKQEGGRRARVLARWVVAGDTLWPHWVDLRTPEPFLL